MTREELVDELARVIHAEVCACGGTGATPGHYQRAARRVLDTLDKRQGDSNERC